MSAFLSRLLKNNSASTSIEYGLIAGLIAAIMLVALSWGGTHLADKFDVIARQISMPSPDDEATGSIMDIKRAKRPVQRP